MASDKPHSVIRLGPFNGISLVMLSSKLYHKANVLFGFEKLRKLA
jgi:hypothetical protein